MLARLRIKVESEELNYRSSSLMQGIMFEHIDADYAAFLHSQSMHPYSQYIRWEDSHPVWVIQTLNKKAYQEIILPLMDSDFQSFYLRKMDAEIPLLTKQVETLTKKELLEEFYEGDTEGRFSVSFLSATSFRQNGKYCILPDVRLVFQNLMNRYSATSEQVEMRDDDILEEIINRVYIMRFRANSVSFPMEGIRIPGFMGNVTFQVKSKDTLKRYIRMLLRFGEYSGVGIKTGMGMGAFCINEGQ